MKYGVEKSIIIHKDLVQVFKIVSNFQTWPRWSPWLIMEPEAKVNFTEDGLEYSWEGEVVGQGFMKLGSVKEFQRIDFDLFFQKPFKSEAQVHFKFNEVSKDQIEVTWVLESELPWFMFWMKNMMQSYIGMDYERGLKLLKDYCEKGEVESHVKKVGVVETQGFKFLGLKRDCSLLDMPENMSRDFNELISLVKQNSDRVDLKHYFSIYHEFDPVKKKCSYTAGVKVLEEFETSSKYYFSSLDGAKAFKVSHTGRYEHLGNAWSTGICYLRAKKIKQSKKKDPVEFYLNSPHEVLEKDLKTEIYFPLKS